MSLLFAMVDMLGQALDPASVTALNDTLFRYPHAFLRQQSCANAVLSCFLTLNTPEAVFDMQAPLAQVEDEMLFAASGRLDNRSELALALALSLTPSLSDAALMRAAYDKWHDAAADKLLGDWAFVAYHPRENQLTVARDQLGYTSIYYYFDGRTLLISSLIDPILAFARDTLRVNADLLISSQLLLKIGDVDASHTYYQDIFRLPPGHILQWHAGRLSTTRYWHPEAIAEIWRSSVTTYADELRALLESAVSARLRSHTPVASMLSGGLDSSSVTCLAAKMLQTQNLPLASFSHVPLYEPSHLEAKRRVGDERPYIEAIIARTGNIQPNYLASSAISPLNGIRRMLDVVKEPIYGATNLYWLYDIYASVQQAGFGSLLTGEMGNATISFSGVEALLPWSVLASRRGALVAIKKKILRPALNACVGAGTRITQPRSRAWPYAYLRPDLPQLRGLRLENSFLEQNFTSARDYALKILAPGSNPRCHLGGVFSQYFGFEMRDPTADRRVAEYCLTIPHEIFFDEKGVGKNLLRTMMKDTLPSSVLNATRKGLQSSDIGLRLKHNAAEMDATLVRLTRSEAVREFMDVARLNSDWHRIKTTENNNYDLRLAGQFLRALMTSLFLHTFETPAATIPG